jgi:hypothetical protein
LFSAFCPKLQSGKLLAVTAWVAYQKISPQDSSRWRGPTQSDFDGRNKKSGILAWFAGLTHIQKQSPAHAVCRANESAFVLTSPFFFISLSHIFFSYPIRSCGTWCSTVVYRPKVSGTRRCAEPSGRTVPTDVPFCTLPAQGKIRVSGSAQETPKTPAGRSVFSSS